MNTKPLPVLAFLDVETTGLSVAYNDRICEVAVLRTGPDGSMTHWQSLVNPKRPLSPAAAAVNGITDAMVADAPIFADVADKVLELVDGAVLVCHNAPFDVSFLSAELESCGRELPNLPIVDTLRIARSHFDFPSNSLGNIASYLKIAVEGQHRAMADVYTTHRVFTYFITELAQQGIHDLDELITSYIRFPSPGGPRELGMPPALEEAIRLQRSVHLCYLSRNGAHTRRIVRPLRIINRDDYLCLEAFCQLRNEKRMFRLDRIVDMKVMA